ncbi:hypothetical protein TWF694_000392 [Orbilia ellipsospora]|uniref:F-box domain-containing protein n=1 Tax=Orbilia ellipsospora TaxID=2528407 RepID=A0AAV9XRU5_9PEZI
MVASITSLPPELIHEILAQPVLTQSDHLNLTKVCKQLHSFARQYTSPADGAITLYANNFAQLTSFIRRLLCPFDGADFATDFHDVTIEWGSKNARHRRYTTEVKEKLMWTEEELKRLAEVYEKFKFREGWRKSIEQFIDPATLLIPIICLLTKIEELAMGVPNGRVDDEGKYINHIDEFFEGLVSGEGKDNVGDVDVLLADYPPSLLNLKTFRRGHYNDELGFGIYEVMAIFLIPGIVTIALDTCAGDFDWMDRFIAEGWECPVKCIEFSTAEIINEEIVKFVQNCECLKSVDISLYPINWGIIEDFDECEEKFSIGIMSQAVTKWHGNSLQYGMIRAERDEWWFRRTPSGKRKSGGKTGWISAESDEDAY